MKSAQPTLSPSLVPIGFFDSGYGGLTILKEVRRLLPHYDFIYLGDNARAPYGSRSFETIRSYTLEAVETLFSFHCPLVILACNTASAKALRSIQQEYLPVCPTPDNRVLGVIRPCVEIIPLHTQTKHVGIFATEGTVRSDSYILELKKIDPDLIVTQEACPMWVPLVENGEISSTGAHYFVKQHCEALMQKDPQIDTVILGCTHYPLLKTLIQQYLPSHITILSQGEIIANSLKQYLLHHQEINQKLSQRGQCHFLTTETPDLFNERASLFMEDQVRAQQLTLPGSPFLQNFSFKF